MENHTVYIKVTSIFDKIKEAEADHRVLYVSAPVGYGKTTAVHRYFRKKQCIYLTGKTGGLDQMPEISTIGQSAIVVDDISWLKDPQSQSYVLELVKQEITPLVLIGRSRLPGWLRPVALEYFFLLADIQDLAFNDYEIRKYMESFGIEMTEDERVQISRFTKGHPLTLLYTAVHMSDHTPFNRVVEEKARLDLFHHFDHAFYEQWDREMRELFLAICRYPIFTLRLAEMVTGNTRIPRLLEYALSVGTFLIKHSEEEYELHFTLRRYLCWKQAIVYTKEQICETYTRGAHYYEINSQIELALKYYELADKQDKISQLLIKNAENHPGTAHFFETRHYYFALPKECILQSPVLMSGMSMLYSMMLQKEESNQWYQELVHFEEEAPKGSRNKLEAKIRLAYLDIGLPQKGIHGVVNIMKNVALMYTNRDFRLPEFSVTSNLPSLMNGGLDFSEWSRNDKELAILMKKPLELVLGKHGIGLVNIALAESGFEKGTMDIYEVIKRLNTGYMMSDTSGKIEMCFAATGLLTKVHIFLGQPKVAEEILSSFHDKAVKEGAPQLLPNLETMQMWLQLLQGKVNVGETWLEHAPNENMGFCTLDRYRYIQKVRCLIASNRYVEALCLIERLDVYFVDYERHYMWMQNQLLKAMIQYRMGNEAWEETLDKALVKMERYHFVRLAGYEGIALKTLLDKMEHPSVSEKFLRKCKKEVDRMAGYYSNYLGIEKQLMEPLTDKESQILQMMCEHQTSEQICERCDFTYSTLKFHNRNIYRKLGVKNRKEAEAAAAQLRLSEK